MHFVLEEKVMRELKYDQFDEHKEDHERLLDSIMNIIDEYTDRPTLDETIFSEQLNSWFFNHFKTKDARVHKFLQH